MASLPYRALVKRDAATPVAAERLHLIRDDSEASLCGIPRGSLAQAGALDQVVCEDCLDWFDKRRAVSARFSRILPRPKL